MGGKAQAAVARQRFEAKRDVQSIRALRQRPWTHDGKLAMCECGVGRIDHALSRKLIECAVSAPDGAR